MHRCSWVYAIVSSWSQVTGLGVRQGGNLEKSSFYLNTTRGECAFPALQMGERKVRNFLCQIIESCDYPQRRPRLTQPLHDAAFPIALYPPLRYRNLRFECCGAPLDFLLVLYGYETLGYILKELPPKSEQSAILPPPNICRCVPSPDIKQRSTTLYCPDKRHPWLLRSSTHPLHSPGRDRSITSV